MNNGASEDFGSRRKLAFQNAKGKKINNWKLQNVHEGTKGIGTDYPKVVEMFELFFLNEK